MKKLLLVFFSLPFLNILLVAQTHKILESTSEFIKIELNFEGAYPVREKSVNGEKFNIVEGEKIFLRNPGEPWLPSYSLTIGIPFNSIPIVKILNTTQEKKQRVFILPTPDSLNQPFDLLPFNQEIYNSNTFFPKSPFIVEDYIVRYAHIASVNISPYQFNPVSRELLFNKKMIVHVDFKSDPNTIVNRVDDNMTDNLLRSTVINYNIAKNFIGKEINYSNSPAVQDTYWYNPQKDYYKIYLNKKGVYRITYDYLVNAGAPPSGLQNNRLELFCNGESIPIDVVDVNSDSLFNSGDYFQFVGEPAKPADQYTRLNIYNTTNVYWFSYQADTLNYYKIRDGYPSGSTSAITSTIKILKWEQDISYHRLGHGRDGQRDYWYWSFAEARNRMPGHNFEYFIEDSIANNFVIEKPQVKVKVGLHGLTATACNPGDGHNATVKINFKPVGSISWDGQEPVEFQEDFYFALYTLGGGDTVQLNYDMQKVEVELNGNICDTVQTDVVLINYIELQYWRWNRTYPNHFYFTSPPNDFGENKYYLWRWMRDNMKVYVPSSGELIDPWITNDPEFSVQFQDTISEQTDYYCVADDYYLVPDSMIHDDPSDLRNISNGADYIIIAHNDFLQAADRLANFRQNNISGYNSPRVKLIEIQDIYDEFSFGLLNPFALKEFAKYTFENWQSPAPYFITLIGDASYDYRMIYSTSRKNYIPSIPFHDAGGNFGQLPSDNSIVAVAGSDIRPDISIGRLSCETIEEANILIDKIINYPSDNSKQWKENVILLASGLSYQDQINLQFNNRAKALETTTLLPNGIHTTKVFNYPEPPDITFLGGGPRMREEINNGAVVVSYYGHGGGGQWDLIFTKDHIPELNNGGKLPFISSITCFTAHFDNAESFGELFNKVPGKGSIGYWGSVSLTWWPTGHTMNQQFFSNIFNNRNYVIGSSIINTLATGVYVSMIPQIVYLGDPALELTIPKHPDFLVKSSDINISPQNPLKDDTVLVAINIENLGVTFLSDSVTIELFKNIPDTSNLIGEVKLSSFGQNEVANIYWVPQEAGLFDLIVKVNEKNIIDEMDHSDNIASRNFTVFDFGEPNIIKPVNGFFTGNDKIDFTFSDIGFLFEREFNYIIQVNNSNDFTGQILFESPIQNPVDGIVRWQSPNLQQGEYFWRAIIYDPIDTNYSPIRIFSVTTKEGLGYLSQKKHLEFFDLDNVDFSPQSNSLVMNTELKPPHPEDRFFLDSIMITLPKDSTQPSTFTTDGTYFYFGHLQEWVEESKIYKVGTGLHGTIAGQNYGSIPDLSLRIYSHLFCKDNFLYTNIGEPKQILQINVQSGDTTSIHLADSLLLTSQTSSQIGGYYFYYDGDYLYNLAMGTSSNPNKFVLRKFDPSNSWSKIGDDLILSGELIPAVTSFIVVNGYIILYENLFANHLRRYRLSDGFYEEEWAYAVPAKDFYAIAYDYVNNFVYFSSFRPVVGTYDPGFIKYAGTYIDANGSITSQEIGPASQWHDLQFEMDQTNSNGIYKAYLLGKNTTSDNWETLDTLNQNTASLQNINASIYNYLQLHFDLVDSSFGGGEPMKFNSLQVNFEYLPEISMIPKDMTFAPDSMLQGIDVNMNLKVYNYGYVPVDSLRLDFYLNEGDSIFFTKYLNVKVDSFEVIDQTINTDTIIFDTKIKAVASSPVQEYFTYNNLIENDFYIARDSTKPIFNITFDGQEILDGDIVSSRPEVVITLRDNTPLQWDESHFTIVYDNDPLDFAADTLIFEEVSPYPNSEVRVTWTPNIQEDGEHTLEVLAKDPSGNFFDSTSYRVSFFVFNNSDIRDVYNYPNPFADNTHFTFELRGIDPPDEFRIRIFTIAGRLIREIIPQRLDIGFNTIYWDGRDHDGDEIANGLYFYKVIYKNDDVVKTVTQKLAKIK